MYLIFVITWLEFEVQHDISQVKLGEHDSQENDDSYIGLGDTPVGKKMGKRPMGEIDCINLNEMHLSPESANKMSKIGSIVDLSQDDGNYIDLVETPKGKKVGKKPINEVQCIDLNDMAFSPEAAVKANKSVIKIEPKE